MRLPNAVGPALVSMLVACSGASDDAQTGDEADLTATADVVFSPQPAESSHTARIAKLIDGAKGSIDIAIYSYSDARIADALKRAVDRGVKVRFIFNDANDQSRAADKAATASGKIE